MLKKQNDKKLRAKVNLYKSEEFMPVFAAIESETNHWRDRIVGTVEVQRVKGDHLTLLNRKRGKELRKIINERLRAK